jgi:hypothetical protein
MVFNIVNSQPFRIQLNNRYGPGIYSSFIQETNGSELTL